MRSGEAVETVNWVVLDDGRRTDRWGGRESIWGGGDEGVGGVGGGGGGLL